MDCILQIKTTAPEKFRVRKSTGTLAPAQQVNVTVTLQPGFNLRTLLHNKFLVMCVPMKDPQMTVEELAEFWKVKLLKLYKIFSQFPLRSCCKYDKICNIMYIK